MSSENRLSIKIEGGLYHEVAESSPDGPEAGSSLDSSIPCHKVKRDRHYHENFIKKCNFDESHIPDESVPKGVTKKKIVKHVLLWADLVVRIRLRKISNERPKFWHYEDKDNKVIEYPLTGSRSDGNGSGSVANVEECKGDGEFGDCSICKENPKSKQKHWKITVWTARHVVYNEEEAKHMIVFFFNDYDYNEVPKAERSSLPELTYKTDERTRVKSGTNYWIMNRKVEPKLDYSFVYIYTCNEGIATRLASLNVERRSLGYELRESIKSAKSVDHSGKEDCKREAKEAMFTCLISHPHGAIKYISVGSYKGENDALFVGSGNNNEKCSKKYYQHWRHTCASCAGSSGGLILCVGRCPAQDQIMRCGGGVWRKSHCGAGEPTDEQPAHGYSIAFDKCEVLKFSHGQNKS